MKEPMQTILMSEHVVQRFSINQNVSCAEGEEAHMPRCDCVDCCTRAKVKRRDWHVLMRANVLLLPNDLARPLSL